MLTNTTKHPKVSILHNNKHIPPVFPQMTYCAAPALYHSLSVPNKTKKIISKITFKLY